MRKISVLLAIAFAMFALPSLAQQTCDLQITVSCPTASSGTSTCTSTTLNSGSNACSGEFFTAFFASGSAQVQGFTNSLGLTQCFDSSIYPNAGEGYAFCFGNASLAPGASFTASAMITGAMQIIGETGVFDSNAKETFAFVYAQANVSAPTCTPVISSPPVTQSGLDYQVSWTTVSDPTAQYVIDESTSPDFTANVSSSQVDGLSKTFRHDVTTATIYYYRVRPTNCAGGSPQTSATSSTVVQAPAPAVSKHPEAVVPFGTKQPVSIKVFIPGSSSIGPGTLSDPTFTAVTDKPYLTVTPSSGTIPPTGTTVTITADPSALPPGASTGTLKVTTNGTTTTNTPVQISLVTPVAPSGRTTPPPNALIIPVVTHVNAAAGPFLSDVRLTNGSSLPMTYQITLTPTRTDGTTSSKATTVTVNPQETTALNDIVKNFFGFGATGASTDTGFGSLEIRPVDSGSTQTFAASRTYASVARGTFGQFIAAIPFNKFATRIPSTPIGIPGGGNQTPPTVLSLQQIAHSSRFRTNIGLAEGAGQPASGIIRIFDALGNDLKDVPFSLMPGEQQQLNGFLPANGVPSLEDGRIQVEITSPTGAVTAYASVLDNVTTDPLAVTPVSVESVSSSRYVLPGIAELNNGANNFHSDVRIFNGGTSDVTANLTFYPQQGLGTPSAPKALTIRRGQVAVLDNILPSFFGLSTTGGSVVVTTPSTSSLVTTARTYTLVENNGTFGQFIPGVMPQEGIGNADRPLQVLQLEQSDQFRSNLGLVELTGNPVTVRVSLYTPDSKTTPSIDVDLGPNEFRQLGGIIATFLGTGTQTYNSRVSVQVTGGTGRVSAYGSVIDNQSGDPTYVPAQ